MKHPFEYIDSRTLRITFVTLLILSILCVICSILIMSTGPSWSDFGKLSVAFNVNNAEGIIAKWTSQQKSTLAFLAGFDFLFGFIWSNFIVVGMALLIRETDSNKLTLLCRILAWGAWIAIILDIPENLSYYIMAVFKVYPILPPMFTIIMLSRWTFATVALFVLIWAYFAKRKTGGKIFVANE